MLPDHKDFEMISATQPQLLTLCEQDVTLLLGVEQVNLAAGHDRKNVGRAFQVIIKVC